MFVRQAWVSVFGLAAILLTLGCHTRNQAATMQASGYEARIGVAVKLNDRICFAIHNSKLLPSATITLLRPTGVSRSLPESARALVLSRNAEACPGTRDDSELSHYNLEVTSGNLELNRPLVGLDARVPSVYAAHSFHSCVSADGIHLTAWDGAKPLEGRRLWAQYYYLAQDMEKNCTPAETAP